MEEQKRLLRVMAAARYLGISPWQLRKLVADEKIPVVQNTIGGPWMLDINDLNKYIEDHKTPKPQQKAEPPEEKKAG